MPIHYHRTQVLREAVLKIAIRVHSDKQYGWNNLSSSPLPLYSFKWYELLILKVVGGGTSQSFVNSKSRHNIFVKFKIYVVFWITMGFVLATMAEYVVSFFLSVDRRPREREMDG